LASPDDVVTASRGLDEDGDRALSASAWKIDRDCIDAATLEADDIGLHRCGVARCAVTEDYAHQLSSATRCCFNHSGEIFTSMRAMQTAHHTLSHLSHAMC
jgi:hypothetical protein